MARPNVTRCEEPSCQAMIIWVETIYGKRQPIDAAPNPEGNIVVLNHTYPDQSQKLVAVALGKLDDDKRKGIERMGLHLRAAHHQTCTNPERFR